MQGPVGKLCFALNRHVFRPAHLHMMLTASGYEPLTTALYMEGDEFVTSDAVFGAKTSLICPIMVNHDDSEAQALGFKRGPFWYSHWDFVLQTREEAEVVKRKSLPNYYRFVDTDVTTLR